MRSFLPCWIKWQTEDQPTDTAASEMFDPITAALSRIATTDDSPEEIMKELQSQLGHIKISKAQ